MGLMNDLTGMQFGHLLAIEPAGKTKDRHILWKCVCECGNITYVSSHSLICGCTKSCGCMKTEMIRKANTKHGFRLYGNMPRIYKTWLHMKDRCKNPNNKSFALYGGRGITICEEWDSDFVAFYEWAMRNGYSEELEIDRIDCDGNYGSDNCRFVTDLEQARNSRRCIYQDIDGEKMCLSEIAEKHQLTEMAMLWRYHKQGKRGKELIEGGKKIETDAVL